MISVQQAQQSITDFISPLGHELVPLNQSLGRVLAQDEYAKLTQPPFDVSSMDGYVVHEDKGKSYQLVADIPAGHPWQGELKKGEAARIYTGAVIPKGGTDIIIQEQAREYEQDGRSFMTPTNPAQKGNWIRPAGLDFHKGDLMKQAGDIISARDIGLMASANINEVNVFSRPQIAIITTGDELVNAGSAIKKGQIINSNGPLLASFATLYGCDAHLMTLAGDDIEALKNTASQALHYDMVITSGGASVGKHDLVRQAFEQIGFKLGFWKVAMRPGKPLIFGHIDDIPVMGLPGNPVSVAVCFLIFVLPALMKMMGAKKIDIVKTEKMELNAPLPENDLRESYWRARIENGKVSAYREQDSAEQVKMAKADCLIKRPPFAPALKKGDMVETLHFPEGLIRF